MATALQPTARGIFPGLSERVLGRPIGSIGGIAQGDGSTGGAACRERRGALPSP
jgi:hypothetical protein